MPNMVRKHIVRGDNADVFFVKQTGERDTIVRLSLHPDILDKTVITDAFPMDSKCLAIATKLEYTTLKEKKQF